MKYVFLLFVFLLSNALVPSLLLDYLEHTDADTEETCQDVDVLTKHNFKAFMRAMLKSLNETQDIKKLEKCLKGGDTIIHRLGDGLESSKVVSSKTFKKGLTQIHNSMSTLMVTLKPCMQDFEKLQELASAIENAKIKEICERIVKNPKNYENYARRAAGCFKSNKMPCMGSITGVLAIFVYMPSPDLDFKLDADRYDFRAFVKNFLKTVGEKKSVENLYKCLKDGDRTLRKFNKTLSALRIIKYKKLKHGLKKLIKNTARFLDSLKPCHKDYDQLQRLRKQLNVKKIPQAIRKIKQKKLLFIKAVNKGLECFRKNDTSCMGHVVGGIVKCLFMPKRDPLYDFLHGLLQGIRENFDEQNLSLCLDIDCDFPQFHKLVEAIIKSQSEGVIKKVLDKPLPTMVNLVEIIRAFSKGKFDKVGLSIGNLLYRVYLEEESLD